MQTNKKDINNLLTDFCNGKINDQDLVALHSWMEESDENRLQANDYLKLYRNYKAYEAFDEIPMDQALNNILGKVEEIKHRRRMVLLQRVAAVAILLIGGIFFFNWFSKQTVEIATTPVSKVIEPGSAKATLILGDGSEINLEEMGDSTIELAEGTNIRKEKSILDYQKSEIKKEIFNTIRIPRGGEYVLVLSDGTKVWLNSDSELTYPVKFLNKTRQVKLIGEAYFEVKRNVDVPFIVNTESSAVEVLGTAFNVKAYAEEKSVETTLVSGKVLCYKKEQRENAVTLEPGTQAIFMDQSQSFEVKKVNTRLYTSWKDGLFVFEKLRLEDIMSSLGRWYNVDTYYMDPALQNLHFTGDLEKYESINTHLEMIALTTRVKFEIKGNTVYVKNN